MRVIETKVYKLDEHPNKEKCFEWIRNNWHDLNQHSVEEVVESLKALQNKIGGTLDWSICQVPDRGEFIRIADYDKDALDTLDPDNCPLTGVWCDYEVIKGVKQGNPELILESLHSDTEYQYSDRS
jgi:hypothetical protein